MTSSKRIPQVGDTVWYYPPAEDQIGRSNNNKGVVSASITRVWGTDATCAVNIKIFPDHGPVQDRGSVTSMYAVKGTRTWCFPGDFPLDSESAPIFAEMPQFPNDRVSTING
jgi:hypothetical protein